MAILQYAFFRYELLVYDGKLCHDLLGKKLSKMTGTADATIVLSKNQIFWRGRQIEKNIAKVWRDISFQQNVVRGKFFQILF